MADTRRIIAAICAAAAVGLLTWQVSNLLREPDPLSEQRDYWVDESSLTFVRRTARDLPPVTEGSSTLVVARCFHGDDGPVIGWLERLPAEVRSRLAEDRARPDHDPLAEFSASMAREVRLPTAGSPWVKADSEQGRRITQPPKRSDGLACMPAVPVP